MSRILRAWMISGVLALVGSLAIGGFATIDPAAGAFTVFSTVVVALEVALVGIWYRSQRPNPPPAQYLAVTLPIPTLVCALSLGLSSSAGAGSGELLVQALIAVATLAGAAATARYWPEMDEPGGYR